MKSVSHFWLNLDDHPMHHLHKSFGRRIFKILTLCSLSLFYPTFPIYSPFSIWGIQKQLGTMTFNSVYVIPFIKTYPLNDNPFILAEWIV